MCSRVHSSVITFRCLELFCFDSHTEDEWKCLVSTNFARPCDHDPGDNAEQYLGKTKPSPCDPCIERRIHETENRMQEASPEKWGDNSSEEDRTFRPHREHCTVEQTDERADRCVNHRCDDQSIPIKPCDVGSGDNCPVCDAGATQQVHGVPNAVLCQISIKEGRENHDDSPGDTSL